MIDLSELQRDALSEMFNIGVGRAAASLSQIVQEEILLSAPMVRLLTSEQAAEELGHAEFTNYSTVTQAFRGPFDAHALLIFPETRALQIVSLMIGQHISPEELSEYEQETMCEIGNIILNACISALADLFHTEFDSTLPVHHYGNYQSIKLSDDADRTHLLLIQVDLIISKQQLQGHILFLMSVNSLHALLDCVNRYLQEQGIA